MPSLRLSAYLVLLEICPDSPSLIISQRVAVLLEQGVNAGDTSVPAVLKVLQCQTPTKNKILHTSEMTTHGALML